MFKIYDGDGIEAPRVYDLVESYEGEVRAEILERYCFDTALEKEYEVETDDGDAIVYSKDWLKPFEIIQLDLISKNAKDSFWVDLTVEKLERALNSHNEKDEIGDQILEQKRDEEVA